jgi:hypothetical protein
LYLLIYEGFRGWDMKTLIYNKIIFKAGLTLFSAIMLSACGATKTAVNGIQSTDYSSRNHPGQSNPGSSVDPGPLLECVSIPTNTSNIEGRLTTYYDNGTFAPTWIRLKFDRLPMQVTSTSNTHYLQIFRWAANASGTKSYNTKPVTMHFLNRTTRTYLKSEEPVTVISKAQIQNLIAYNNLSSTNADNFFDKYLLILEGMDLVYDAVTFAIYDSNQGTKAIANHDVLLPAFSAEPNAYAANHPQAILQQLHPYWSQRSDGLSANHFLSLSVSNCIP